MFVNASPRVVERSFFGQKELLIGLFVRFSPKTPYVIAVSYGTVIILIALVQHNAGVDERSAVFRPSTAYAKNKGNVEENAADKVTKSLFELNQDDPRLINKIKKGYLFPPSLEPYNLTRDDENPSVWQGQFVKDLLQQKKNGFYVDAGANEGEWISNTLAFEKQDGWEGILVEAVPENFQLLQSKHRKAFTVPACLSDTKYPKKLEFQKLGPRSRLISMMLETNKSVVVQCFPIYSILLAAGRTKIDYFSLDVEGSELDVLETIPWDKVEITVISVEYDNIVGKKRKLRDFMKSKGYSWVDHPPTAVLGVDYIFYRKDLLPK